MDPRLLSLADRGVVGLVMALDDDTDEGYLGYLKVDDDNRVIFEPKDPETFNQRTQK